MLMKPASLLGAIGFLFFSLATINGTPSFEQLPYEAKSFLQEYHVPRTVGEKLDSLFAKKIVRMAFIRKPTKKGLQRLGFRIFKIHKRMCVFSHPKFDDYIFKIHLKTLTKPNYLNQDVALSAFNRVRHSKNMRSIIKNFELKHVQVPKEWVYHLPGHSYSLQNSNYILVAERKHEKKTRNYEDLSAEEIQEIALFIQEARYTDVVRANLLFTERGIAFIDTETPPGDDTLVRNALNAISTRLPQHMKKYLRKVR